MGRVRCWGEDNAGRFGAPTPADPIVGEWEKTDGQARSLCLDLLDQWRGFEKNGQFRFTAPTHSLLAFRQALREMESLGAGFFLHDMGKTQVPIEIIQKPGPLTPEERTIINRHPEDGYVLLEEAGVMTETIKVMTLQHHEKDDGTGYPYGLKAGDIHPLARICRLVDVYEAITAKRPYHEPRTTFEALRLMQEHLLTDMDKHLFDTFVRLFAS